MRSTILRTIARCRTATLDDIAAALPGETRAWVCLALAVMTMDGAVRLVATEPATYSH